MSEKDKGAGQGALSGAATGASAGASVGVWFGGVGAVVGAVIGAVVGGVVGGVGGMISGGHKQKAKLARKQAAAIHKQREEEAYRQSILSQIRQARISRASMLATTVAAGSEEGSGSQGALASYGAQLGNVVEYMSVDRGRAIQEAALWAKAKKNESVAQTVDTTTNGVLNLGASIASAYGKSKQASAYEMQGQYKFGQDGSLELGGGMPYLNEQGTVRYVPQGQTRTISYK